LKATFDLKTVKILVLLAGTKTDHVLLDEHEHLADGGTEGVWRKEERKAHARSLA
jgi:hypothetical protein